MTAYAPEAPLGAAPSRAGAAAREAGRPSHIPVTRPEVPDAVLVARCLGDDDRHAFAELTRRHQSAVRSLLRRLTRGNEALADDLAQDTFVQVWRNLRQFRGDARFSTWIYRIAYNAFLAHARATHREEPLPEQLPAQLPENESGRSLALESAMRMDLAKALARLSESERAAIIHCYYRDLSHEEAAYVLGCPLGTLKSNVLRAKQKLRRVLAAWAPVGARLPDEEGASQ